MENVTRSDLKKLLVENKTVELEFIKTNGETRVAKATLEPSQLPSPLVENTVNAEVLTYFDLEKNDWRSLRVRNLTKYSVVE